MYYVILYHNISILDYIYLQIIKLTYQQQTYHYQLQKQTIMNNNRQHIENIQQQQVYKQNIITGYKGQYITTSIHTQLQALLEYIPTHAQINAYMEYIQTLPHYKNMINKQNSDIEQYNGNNEEDQNNTKNQNNNKDRQKDIQLQQQLYSKWQQYQQYNKLQYSKMCQIISGTAKQSKYQKQSNQQQNQNKQQPDLNKNQRSCCICGWSQGNIGVKKWQWCRICGRDCCQECVGRYRILPNSKRISKWENKRQLVPVPICQQCDNQYLQAIVYFQDKQQLALHSLCLQILKTNQHNNNKQPNKQPIVNHQNRTSETKTLPQLLHRISHLKTINTTLSYQNSQLNRKTQFGKNLTKQLQQKYKKLRRQQLKLKNSSFTSSVIDDTLSNTYTQSQNLIRPPKAYQSQAGQEQKQENFNSSALQSILEDQSRLIYTDRKKCCTQCTIM